MPPRPIEVCLYMHLSPREIREAQGTVFPLILELARKLETTPNKLITDAWMRYSADPQKIDNLYRIESMAYQIGGSLGYMLNEIVDHYPDPPYQLILEAVASNQRTCIHELYKETFHG